MSQHSFPSQEEMVWYLRPPFLCNLSFVFMTSKSMALTGNVFLFQLRWKGKFLGWARNSLIPALFPSNAPDQYPYTGIMKNSDVSTVLGVGRIRQLRIKKGKCRLFSRYGDLSYIVIQQAIRLAQEIRISCWFSMSNSFSKSWFILKRCRPTKATRSLDSILKEDDILQVITISQRIWTFTKLRLLSGAVYMEVGRS